MDAVHERDRELLLLSSPVFTYSDGQVCAAKYAGNYKVVYFGFGLEAADSEKDTPIGQPSPIRTELLRRIINWLNLIVYEPLRDTEEIQHPQPITAKIKGSLPDLQSVAVCWRLWGEDDFKTIPMTKIEDTQYTAEIPGPGIPAVVEYYLQTTYPGLDWFCPIGAPDSVYAYYAGTDTIMPEITQVSRLPNRLSNMVNYPVLAIITDNLGIDSSSVLAHYQVSNRNVIDSVLLAATGEPNHFSGILPAVFLPGDSVAYRVTAKDQSVSRNNCASPWQSFLIGYEDFENGLADWQVDSSGWALSETCHGGKYSVCTSPAGSYQTNLDISLTSKYGMDLSQTKEATLTFWTAYFIEQDKDFGTIEISTDSAATWQRLDITFIGTQDSWKEESISLSNFTGAEFTDLRLRFRFISDSTQTKPSMGWFIDDIRIPEKVTGIAVNEPTQPDRFSLSQNYPNPFNPTTMINYQLPMTNKVDLSIYNILGEKLVTLVNKKQPAGRYEVEWNASNYSSGVYLYRLSVGSLTTKSGHYAVGEAGEYIETRKMILIK